VELRPTGGFLHISTTGKPARHRDVEQPTTFRRMGGSMLVSTALPLEAYVAGVVQAESGDKRPAEYYKLQAVICRTYALTNARKHLAEGFAVCDGTHCQVYKGRCTLPEISKAVADTRDMVVVDAGIRLIHATFHSNCGGETINAEDVWSKSEPYLVSAIDTFCVRSTHATWQRTMPRAEWLGYLQRSFALDPGDTASVRAVTHFAPPCRSIYFDGARPRIALARVRQDLRLNSTYFHVRSAGDQIILEGRGFGHGVGLCQEGAMRMAELGLPFTAILHHYFAEVHLVDLNSLAFFRDEDP
jgi:stage II sporulation protein D